MKKIAIIGGGWVGCHLASKLKHKYNINILEHREKLFTQSSYSNQNRLHFGFHYARNYKTRELCRNTFDRFIQDYGQFTKVLPRNYYCVPEKSNIDYITFLQIFSDFDVIPVEQPLDNIEGCILTKERYIDFDALHEHFNHTLKKHHIVHHVENPEHLLNEYDFVINATNNFLCPRPNSYYELTITLLYNRIQPIDFDAMTLVDGDFFSIYPYKEDKIYTLTDVEHTPVCTFDSIGQLEKYTISSHTVQTKRNKMESKVLQYYPQFLQHFEYSGYFMSVKSKMVTGSADRSPIIEQDGNIVHCYTGKIQGIYYIQDSIEQYEQNRTQASIQQVSSS